MIDKLTLKPAHRFRERGSVLPVAIGLGAITSLLATTMLVRSHNDQISVVTNDAIAKSETVAELGINRYKDFINKHRGILPERSACVNWNDSGTCDDVPEAVGGYPISGTWKSNAVYFGIDPTEILSMTNQNWQDVSGDPKDGQYRLIDYTYLYTYPLSSVVTGTGILIVEGRVNQKADGTEGAGTAKRRLRVQFPLTPLVACTTPRPTGGPGNVCGFRRLQPNTSWEIVESTD